MSRELCSCQSGKHERTGCHRPGALVAGRVLCRWCRRCGGQPFELLPPEAARGLWTASRSPMRGGYEQIHAPGTTRMVGCEWHPPQPKQRRALCRACGKAIDRTSPRILCVMDPDGNGWTARYWWVHPTPCLASEPASV